MMPVRPEFDAPERIQEYLDGALSPAEERAFEAFMEVSPTFRAEVREWEGLLSRLASLPRLHPSPGFGDRVMAAFPTRAPLRHRIRVWWDRTLPAARASSTGHPPSERLQEFLDGTLPTRLAARIQVHLDTCVSCREETQEWQELFGTLRSLPGLDPSMGFADRVMEALPLRPVAVPARGASAPGWMDRLAARGRSLVPVSGRARALVAAMVATPAALVGLVAFYVMAHPLLSPGHLASFALWQAGDVAAALGSWVSTRLIESALTFRIVSLVEALAGAPLLAVFGIVTFCVATLGSLWVLHRYLMTPPTEGRYVQLPV